MESLKETPFSKDAQKCEKDDSQLRDLTSIDNSKSSLVPLEVLFSSPIFLKSNKAIEFLEKCHDATKEGPTMEEFRQVVNENAIKGKVWPEGKTWEDVINENEESLEKTHFTILRTFIKKDGTHSKKLMDVDTSLATELIRVLRNRCSHKGWYREDVLETMGWGKLISGKLEFCDEKFVTYWTSRFPKLLPFMWEQYKGPVSEKNPGGAYPPFFKSQYSSCCIFDDDDSNEDKKTRLGEKLTIALSINLEQGWLEDRFTFENDAAMTLEFRTLELSYLEVNRFHFLEIEIPGIGEQRIIRKWYEILNAQITLSEENSISLAFEKVDSSRETFFGTIVVCNKLSDLSKNFLEEKCIEILKTNKKLIIFTNREHNLEDKIKLAFVKKLCIGLKTKYFSRPVAWSDLRISVQKKLVEQVDIKIEGISIKFEDFLRANYAEMSNLVLLNLQGTELNEMLKNKTIVVSALDTNIKPPTSEQTYISRKVYSRGNVSSNFFQNQATKSQNRNRFIIVQKVPNDQSTIFTKIHSLNEFQNIDINDSKSTLFYVEEPLQNFEKISIHFKCSVEAGVNVHIFECLEDDRFEWVTTMHGSFTEIHECLYKEAEMGACDQKIVLNNILKSKMRRRMIFISDEPGMGKTELLLNFAEKIKRRENTCILLLEMQNIVERIVGKVEGDQVINSIIDISYAECFQKEIMRYLLSSNSFGIQFEIMIDGLDEVQFKHRNLAYDVLKLIQRKFPWVRVWLTGRDYLLEEVRKQLGVLGYKFLPFTKTEQITYLKRFWRESWDNSGKRSNAPSDTTLESFANLLLSKCVFESETHLAGIPLQISGIAEIFEEKVLNGDFSLDDTPAFNLHTMYEQMFNKKFRIYWAEKQKLPENKGQDVAETQRKEIDRFLMYSAIKLIFSEETADKLKFHLEIPRKNRDLEKLKIDALKHGIIQSLTPLRFIHRTFAEYIVASFISREVDECLEINEFLDSLEEVVKEFILNEILATEGSSYTCEFQHINVTSFLNMTLEPVLSNVSNIFREQEITPAYYKLVKIFKKLMRDGVRYLSNKFSMQTTLHDTAYKMGYKYILTVLIILSESPLNSFVFVLNNSLFEISKFIVAEMNFGPEHWHMVREFDESKSGILHRAMSSGNLEMALFFIQAVEQNRSLLEERDANGQMPFLAAIKFALELANEFENIMFWLEPPRSSSFIIVREASLSEFMNDKDDLIRSSLIQYQDHKKVVGKLVELGSDFNTTDNSGNTALHMTLSYHPPWLIFSDACDLDVNKIRDIDWYIKFATFFLPHNYNWAHLNQFNKAGSTPLLCFLDNLCLILEINQELAQKHIAVLNEVFGVLQKFGMDFNARDTERDETILHKVIKRKYPLIFIELMVSHGASVLDKNGKGQCAVHLAVECGHVEVKTYFLEINSEWYDLVDNEGKTVRDYELEFLE